MLRIAGPIAPLLELAILGLATNGREELLETVGLIPSEADIDLAI
jgi:hypothetical protein